MSTTTQPGSNRLSSSQAVAEGLDLKAIAKLVWRTWPYLRPQLPHLLTWIGLTLLVEVVFIASTLVAFDLFNNKVLLGEKLEPIQASLLQLDQDYVSTVPAQERPAPA